MNIHRKDKAKLKKATSDEADQHPYYSLDISKQPASLFSPIAPNTKDLAQPILYSTEERCKIPWPNWFVSTEEYTTTRAETLVGEPQKLSFLRDHMRSIQDIGTDNGEKGLSSGHGSSGAELDLELRLGQEPHGPSKASGTKKFF